MKKLFLFSLLLTMISCNFQEKQPEEFFPFENVEIIRIHLNGQTGISDSLGLKEIHNYLQHISSENLIKGKRLHGAKTLCNLTIESQENSFMVVIKEHVEEGVTASFLEKNVDDNFNYSLGTLYNAEAFVQLLKDHGLNCEIED